MMDAPPAIVQRVDTTICTCPICRQLDALFPGQGVQLALVPAAPSSPIARFGPLDRHYIRR